MYTKSLATVYRINDNDLIVMVVIDNNDFDDDYSNSDKDDDKFSIKI